MFFTYLRKNYRSLFFITIFALSLPLCIYPIISMAGWFFEDEPKKVVMTKEQIEAQIAEKEAIALVGLSKQQNPLSNNSVDLSPAGLADLVEKELKSGTSGEWNQELVYSDKKYKIEYNFDPHLTQYVRELLKSYRSDYTTVAVIDNATGNVLAAVGYVGKSNSFDKSLILTSNHPSASLIKMITAAELIQNTTVNKDTPFDFKGRSTTLFKYQIKDSGRGARFNRTQTFETAFAKSNNVIFGKAAIQNTSSDGIVSMAKNFGFLQPLLSEFKSLKSNIEPAHDDYSLAELASGYNTTTTISPIHAAVFASIIANDGVLRKPHLISKIVDLKNNLNIWLPGKSESRAIAVTTAREMKEIMSTTIDGGTAKKSFRRMRSGYKNNLEIGGKTGTITGGFPYGKRDWFAAYAKPRDEGNNPGISLSVMNINVKKWHVKSSMLAKDIIEYYYKNIYKDPISSNNQLAQKKSKKSIGRNTRSIKMTWKNSRRHFRQ